MNTSFNHELQQLQMELRAQNFDIIRFSTYRTACKLRFIQKKLHFHHLDLLNVIESLRESLTSLSSERHTSISSQFLSINHLITFLTSIYTNLNKRLPLSQQILHIDNCVHSAIAWFLYVYNNSIRFNSFRVVLILLCTGKLIDKMRHLFTSYSLTTLTYGQIDDLLHEILALPYALQEISYETYRKNYAQTIFSHLSSPISLTNFLDILIYNNSAPNCLQWLIIFHRLISVENVIHRVKCSACQRPSFSGFRYKCQQCHHRTYQLCQDCFWRGRTSNQHLSTHEMKEYTYFIPHNKDFRHSIRKSFQCMPKNEKCYQLSSPLTIDKEQRISQHSIRSLTPTSRYSNEYKTTKIINDEHQQIASYSNQLALLTEKKYFNSVNNQSPIRTYRSQRGHVDHQRAEKKLIISKLEAENRRILHEINTLRSQLKHQSLEHIVSIDDTNNFSPIDRRYTQTLPSQHEYSSSNHFHKIRRAGSVESTNKNSYFEHELRSLLTYKNQLESRIHQLQQSREELTSQLDDLGPILRYSPQIQRQRSATSSPYGHLSGSPTRINSKNASIRSYSTPTTPVHNRLKHHLRTDLLQAADSLTSAISSLVRQLNTEGTESLLTGIKTENKFHPYPYENDNRTDEELFLTSDDDDCLKTTDDDDEEDDNRALNLSSINRKIRENRLFI